MARDHEADLVKFMNGEPVDIGETLRSLPRTASVPMAVAVVLRLIDHPHWLATSCKQLPVKVIRGVLAATAPGPAHLFLRLAVPVDAKAAQLKTAWQAAVGALHQLADTAPWESAARRAALTALAGEPQVLQALQGVVANTASVQLEMLAVLAIDGGDASVDALIPHLDPALGERDARLERLALLRGLAKRTPALDTLFAELDHALVERRRTSPALALGPVIGIGELDVLWCKFMLCSNQRNELSVPRVQGAVAIDSREDAWFSVWVSTVAGTHDRAGDRTTRFDEARVVEDQLDIGRCEPAELPAWLAAAAKRLKIQWDRFLLRTNASDAQREVIARWLVVAAPPTPTPARRR